MAGEMVLIACKAPSGLVLNLDEYELLDPGNRSNPNVRRKTVSQTVTLKGWAHKFNQADVTMLTGGYAFTPVPLDFWDKWFERNKGSSLIADRIILLPHRSAESQARAHETVPRMYPSLDPANPRDPTTGNVVAGVTMDESTKRTLAENGSRAAL